MGVVSFALLLHYCHMSESVFLTKSEVEHPVYAMQRDHRLREKLRAKYEAHWQVFQKVAYEGFREKFQREFYSCWWEMYLGVSIINRRLPVVPGRPNEGPDFQVQLDDGSTVWVEATAPQRGTSDDQIPLEKYDGQMTTEPTDEAILRFTQAMQVKRNKFEEYTQNGIVDAKDGMVIALSPCSFQDEAMMSLEFDEPYPLAFLAGFDASKVVVRGDGSIHWGGWRQTIQRKSGSPVRVDPFAQPEFSIISGVLYTVESPFNPETEDKYRMRLYLNPEATNPLPASFAGAFETWHEDKDAGCWHS